jgi:hypothetical protein
MSAFECIDRPAIDAMLFASYVVVCPANAMRSLPNRLCYEKKRGLRRPIALSVTAIYLERYGLGSGRLHFLKRSR